MLGVIERLSIVESMGTRTLVQKVLGKQWSSIRAYELEAHGVMQVNCDKSLRASWSSKSAPDEADLADGKQASLSCRITIASVWMSYVVFWQDEKAILDRPISQRHPYLA